jgi:hypothetical protein
MGDAALEGGRFALPGNFRAFAPSREPNFLSSGSGRTGEAACIGFDDCEAGVAAGEGHNLVIDDELDLGRESGKARRGVRSRRRRAVWKASLRASNR